MKARIISAMLAAVMMTCAIAGSVYANVFRTEYLKEDEPDYILYVTQSINDTLETVSDTQVQYLICKTLEQEKDRTLVVAPDTEIYDVDEKSFTVILDVPYSTEGRVYTVADFPEVNAEKVELLWSGTLVFDKTTKFYALNRETDPEHRHACLKITVSDGTMEDNMRALATNPMTKVVQATKTYKAGIKSDGETRVYAMHENDTYVANEILITLRTEFSAQDTILGIEDFPELALTEVEYLTDGYITEIPKRYTRLIKVTYADDLSMEDALAKIAENPAVLAVMPNLILELASEKSIIAGDVNLDGKVSLKDVSLLLQAIVGKVELDEDQFIAADWDKNGKLNAKDVSCILQWFVKERTVG